MGIAPFWGSDNLHENSSCDMSSGASRGAPHGMAILKVRMGTFDASQRGSGALGK